MWYNSSIEVCDTVHQDDVRYFYTLQEGAKDVKFTKKAAILILSLFVLGLSSCTESARARENLRIQADNFNCVRSITVIDCITGDVMFQMTGNCSIVADTTDHQLEVIVEVEKGVYKKHIIGLSDNVTYIIEDITDSNVSEYSYELNFNPKMWLPVKPAVID